MKSLFLRVLGRGACRCCGKVYQHLGRAFEAWDLCAHCDDPDHNC